MELLDFFEAGQDMLKHHFISSNIITCSIADCIRLMPRTTVALTASSDRSLRRVNVLHPAQNSEISQGKALAKTAAKMNIRTEELKLSPVISMDCSQDLNTDWDTIITAHENSTKVRTWNFQKAIIGKHVFKSKSSKSSVVQSVALSTCGNFCLLGTASGWIDKFNMQSGEYRGTYKVGDASAHLAGVTGLVTDGFNRNLISTSLDQTIKVCK
jgi:U3 small nucleolar RNA-associated protein 21